MHSEVSSLLLFGLDCLEERLEVTSTEALMVSTLDDLEEESWSVFERLGEDLEQVALVVVVDEDLLPLQDVDVLLHLDRDVLETRAKVVIVGVGNLIQEKDATVLHASDRLDDGLSAHGNVLELQAEHSQCGQRLRAVGRQADICALVEI